MLSVSIFIWRGMTWRWREGGEAKKGELGGDCKRVKLYKITAVKAGGRGAKD